MEYLVITLMLVAIAVGFGVLGVSLVLNEDKAEGIIVFLLCLIGFFIGLGHLANLQTLQCLV